uniref:ARID domain-containing protein n=2 Tax=Kalanchoe fedtschenkoi TaxID=63787 RepID=A0A7N0T077_KALFE
MVEGLDKDMLDAGAQEQEDQHTVDVDGLNGQNPNETVQFVNGNPILPDLGVDNADGLLNKETDPTIGEGDCAKVEAPVSITTYETGTEVGRKNGLNGREMVDTGESATEDETILFMRELGSFYRERGLEFKPPKFYGEPLDCLKLWRAVIQLGGYDRVTGAKLWRQVGESFNPPKTCTTVSWTFRIFYEKVDFR